MFLRIGLGLFGLSRSMLKYTYVRYIMLLMTLERPILLSLTLRNVINLTFLRIGSLTIWSLEVNNEIYL